MRLIVVSALALGVGCSGPPGGQPDAAARDAALADAPAEDAAPETDAPPPVANLTVNAERSLVDLALERRTFALDACELDPSEACIGAPGERRLLRFGVETPNLGTADLFLGAPNPENPHFVWSDCHKHYHFEGYATYRLLDGEREVVLAQKQAYCLVDTVRYLHDDPSVPDEAAYTCGYQGIQRGWSDIYDAAVPCQFLDVTDVPDGSYTLEIEVNAEGLLEELSLADNRVTLPVELGSAAMRTPTEPCPAELSTHVTDGAHRECGWEPAGTYACTPGTTVRVGCAAACSGLGACTGDPILRVCDADRPDGNCSYAATLASAQDNACGSPCPIVPQLRCPASGNLAVYTAPHRLGEPYSCDLSIEPVP